MAYTKFFVKETDILDYDFIQTIPEFRTLIQNESAWNTTKNLIRLAKIIMKEDDVLKIVELSHKRLALITLLFHNISGNNNEKLSSNTTRKVLNDYDFHTFQHEMICNIIRHQTLLDKFDFNNNTSLLELDKTLYDFHNSLYLKIALLLYMVRSIYQSGENDIMFKQEVYFNVFKVMHFYNKKTSLRDLQKDLNRIDNDINANHKNVYILCGISGSGKSTFIKQNITLDESSSILLSRDIIRAELNIGGATTVDDKVLGNKEEEQKVTDIFNKRLKDSLNNDKINTIVIDNTNLNKKYIVDLLMELYQHQVVTNCIFATSTPLSVCMERRGVTDENNYVNQQLMRMDAPRRWMFDNLIFI